MEIKWLWKDHCFPVLKDSRKLRERSNWFRRTHSRRTAIFRLHTFVRFKDALLGLQEQETSLLFSAYSDFVFKTWGETKTPKHGVQLWHQYHTVFGLNKIRDTFMFVSQKSMLGLNGRILVPCRGFTIPPQPRIVLTPNFRNKRK